LYTEQAGIFVTGQKAAVRRRWLLGVAGTSGLKGRACGQMRDLAVEGVAQNLLVYKATRECP